MKKQFILLLTLLWLAPLSQAQNTLTLDSTVVNYETTISGIDIPWEIKWGADNWIWMTERYGRVSRVNPNNGQQVTILDLSNDVYEASEAGLLGFEFHPNFPDSNYIYLAYTYGGWGNIRERMVRYEYDGTSLVNPMTIVEDIPGNTTHIGCRLLALPDNTLLMTTGDAQNTAFCQDVTSLNGKVLRYNLDGTIPADNPIAGSPVYSWGHRNAQGLEHHNGIIYCSEHGPSNDDEFHIIEKGRNYGWPNVEGLCNTPNEITFCNDSSVVEPLAVWTPTIAPSDIIWYDHPSIPEWEGTILMTVLKDKNLTKIEFNANGDQIVSMQEYFNNQFNRLRDICVSPTGAVYLATNGSSWSNNNPFSHSIVKVWNNNFTQVGLTENVEQSFMMMPNPAESEVRLAFTSGLIGGELQVFNVTGQLVHEEAITQGQIQLDRGNLPAGTYVVQVRNGQQALTQKLILR